TVQTPATSTSVTSPALRSQTPLTAKLTGRPEEAVATGVKAGSPIWRSGSGAKSIVCASFGGAAILGAVIVKVRAWLCQSASLARTLAVPSAISRAEGTVARSLVELTNSVARALPFQ